MENLIIISYILAFLIAIVSTFLILKTDRLRFDKINDIAVIWLGVILCGWVLGLAVFGVLLIFLIESWIKH